MSITTTEPLSLPRGLAGVQVTDTELGDVRGAEGFFHYRQHSALDVAREATFEEAWYFYLYGRFPDLAELTDFGTLVGDLRALPTALADMLPLLCRTTRDPLQVLRSALSQVGADEGLMPVYDLGEDQRTADGLRLAAVTPTILAAAYRLTQGLDPVPSDPRLGHAEDYLQMVTGDVPAARDVRAIEQYLTLTIDHGFNASTFTARVIASTGADMAACVVGALGSFSGPLHGGAPSRALAALEEIGTPDRTRDWVRTQIATGARIMGFGHAVYRTRDPRAELLKQVARGYDDALPRFAEEVEQVVEDTLAELKPGRELHANVEFYAGVLMSLTGLPPAMFSPTFCVARVVGWTTNVLEQARDPKIFRPAARYVGPAAPQPVPSLASRSAARGTTPGRR